MGIQRKSLYAFLLAGCAAGYGWLFLAMSLHADTNSTVCFIKRLTGIPCPSCGATRSVLKISDGHFREALLLNPLGYLLAMLLLTLPVWILSDFFFKRESLYAFYQKIESQLKRPVYAIPLSALILINWIWNIIKGI